MATAGTGGEVLNTGPGEVGRAAGVDGDERREVDLDQPLRRYCPAGQLPTPWAQTQALGSCVSPRGSELRLGYHAGTDGTDGAIHGVRTAIAAIDQLGLLDEWNTTITPFWRPVHMDPGVAVEAALELTQTERVNVVVGGGYSEISEQAQYIFKLCVCTRPAPPPPPPPETPRLTPGRRSIPQGQHSASRLQLDGRHPHRQRPVPHLLQNLPHERVRSAGPGGGHARLQLPLHLPRLQ